ncbi:MAG: GatB/YqeY domain-containing protein [Pseudomonadota bacterium]
MSETLPLRERIDAALKTAMKARDDKTRVATLRLINAAIKDRDIDARAGKIGVTGQRKRKSWRSSPKWCANAKKAPRVLTLAGGPN